MLVMLVESMQWLAPSPDSALPHLPTCVRAQAIF